ncbi:MAG: phosphocholine cytidylyltransferase family protein [Desulfurivibrionaceae bacterium]
MNPSIAIILAAGMGVRLNPLTGDLPKCLIPLNGLSLLERCITTLTSNGVKTIVVVIGFQGDKIRQALETRGHGATEIVYVESPDYRTTNNIVSLWLAREYLEQGAYIIEGDVAFDESAFSKLVQDPGRSLWMVDRFRKGMDGCLLMTGEGNRVVSLQIVREELKDYTEQMFKSVGILKVCRDTGKLLSRLLDEEVGSGNKNIYYDLVFSKYIDKLDISICGIEGMKWAEIDTINDLHYAEGLFSHE